MILNADMLLAMSALTIILGLILLVAGVAGLRKRPAEGSILATVGEVLIIVGFIASRHAE